MKGSTTRRLTVVSGYYGFENLGDEAILEELLNELKRLGDPTNIIVLSASPGLTEKKFAVQARSRTDLPALIDLLKHARLFVSGGGGLFQNTTSLRSVAFYGLQILAARALGVEVAVYAQGIGPLHGYAAECVTRRAMKAASAITVRDRKSLELLKSWQINAELSADPVWCLDKSPLPQPVDEQLRSIENADLVALSLRRSPAFTDSHCQTLLEAMQASMPGDAHLLLVPLQLSQDEDLLQSFARQWRQKGRRCTLLDTQALSRPSQFLSLFERCQLVVGMRLHALIMSLKAGVGVVGLTYDPKVSELLGEFEQPGLILANEPAVAGWQQTLTGAFADREKLSRLAIKKAECAKKLACQNFNLLARISSVQEDG